MILTFIFSTQYNSIILSFLAGLFFAIILIFGLNYIFNRKELTEQYV